jgi:hypothetical protein
MPYLATFFDLLPLAALRVPNAEPDVCPGSGRVSSRIFFTWLPTSLVVDQELGGGDDPTRASLLVVN